MRLIPRLGSLAVVAAAAALLAAPSAEALTYDDNVIPQATLDEFKNCPEFPNNGGQFCFHLKSTDGEIQLGSVKAKIDQPLDILVGVGTGDNGIEFRFGGPGASSGGGSGSGSAGGGAPGFAPIKISGGILGAPQLDPLIDAEPLGLLRLTAAPQIGDLGAQLGNPFGHIPNITLPISIKLNNPLFGKDCQIGTPEDPIKINLTDDTSDPPLGVQPLTGKVPDFLPETAWWNYSQLDGSPAGFEARAGGGTGARYVDNGFDVPGAKRCDLLPRQLHDALDAPVKQLDKLLGSKLGLNDLIGKDGGLFNPVINAVAGLPSPAGKNRMTIGGDITWVDYEVVDVIRDNLKPTWAVDPGTLEFGDVPLGQTATKSVTVKNPTDDPMTFGVSTFNPVSSQGDFGVVDNGCINQTIAPGGTCELRFSYAPSKVGATTPDAFFVQSIPGRSTSVPFRQQVNVVLRGTGVALKSAATDFGAVDVGQPSDVKTVKFENVTAGPLAVGQAPLVGTGAATHYEIVADRCSGETVSPGASCEVDVRFVPKAVGDLGFTTTVDSAKPRVELREAGGRVIGTGFLRGTGIALLRAHPNAVAVGSVVVGETVTRTIGFEGTSSHPATVTGATASGAWQVTEDSCTGRTLARGERCQLEVAFAPTSLGSGSVTLQLKGPDSTTISTVSLTGTGINPLVATPASLTFGNVVVGEARAPQTVAIKNVANQAKEIGEVVLTGTASRFSSWQLDGSGCAGKTLAPGGSCSVAVGFAPDSTGTKAVTVSIRGSGGEVLGTVALSGSGINSVIADPSSAPFGSVPVGQQSAPQTIKFTGMAQQAVQIEDVGLSGTASRFTSWQIDGSGCAGRTLAAGESCSATVVFAPDSTGTKTVTLNARASGGAVLASATLTGSVTAP